jgi:hypothetical protein
MTKTGKHEIRNSKQIQNDEKQNNYNAPNGEDRIHCLGFSDFEFILAPVCFDPRGRFRISRSKILTLAGDNLNPAKERFCAKHALRLIEEAPSRKATLIFRNRHVTRQHETPGRIACFQCDQPLRILSSHFRILKVPMPSHT